MTRIRALSVASLLALVPVLLSIEEAVGPSIEFPSITVWLLATALVTAFTAALVYALRNSGSIASPVPTTAVPTWALQAMLDRGVYNALRDSDVTLVAASWRSLRAALDDGTIDPDPLIVPTVQRPVASPVIGPADLDSELEG